MKRKVLMALFVCSTMISCVAVKEYEKVKINDPDMVLAERKSDRYILTFQAYRGAATGANGGKTGGGCGCN